MNQNKNRPNTFETTAKSGQKTQDLQPDLLAAETFLNLLDPEAKQFTFQIFRDREGSKISPQVIHGSLEDVTDQLTSANRNGAGVFVTVNETNGRGRSAADITRVRALFVDLDGPPIKPVLDCPTKPHMIVQSSEGKYHAYWLVKDVPLEHFSERQAALAAKFEGDPSIKDLSRVMRLPGFFHQKEGTPRLCTAEKCADSGAAAEPLDYSTFVEALRLDDALPNNVLPFYKQPESPPGEWQPAEEGARNTTCASYAGQLISYGLSDDEALEQLMDWNSKNQPPLSHEEVESTFQSIKNTHARKQEKLITDSFAYFNERYSVVLIGDKARVLTERYNPDTGMDEPRFLTTENFRVLEANRPDIGRQAAANAWLKSEYRREYKDVTFVPGAAPEGYYNLYRGFAVDPVEGDCSLFTQHVRENICANDQRQFEYVMGWMAHAVQQPKELPGVALVLQGRQGTGKGIFATEFGALFGQHFKHIQHERHLTGNFNNLLADALIIFADEVVWGGDKQREGALKTMVTETKRTLEKKGVDAIQMNNYARIIMASNNDWVTPAGMEERRFFVMRVSDTRMQDHKYFENIIEQMRTGGREALLHHLQEYDLQGFNVRNFPKTGALLEQKLLGLDSARSFIYECLQEGHIVVPGGDPLFAEIFLTRDWPDICCKAALHRAYASHAKRHGDHRPMTNAVFFKRLRGLLPPFRDIKTGSANTGRKNQIVLPNLQACRIHFEGLLGQPIDWDE